MPHMHTIEKTNDALPRRRGDAPPCLFLNMLTLYWKRCNQMARRRVSASFDFL